MPDKNIHEDSVNKDARNIPLSERMRSNIYPDSAQKLDEDLIDTNTPASGGMQVKSDEDGVQEWDAREDVQDLEDEERTERH